MEGIDFLQAHTTLYVHFDGQLYERSSTGVFFRLDGRVLRCQHQDWYFLPQLYSPVTKELWVLSDMYNYTFSPVHPLFHAQHRHALTFYMPGFIPPPPPFCPTPRLASKELDAALSLACIC